MTDWDPSRLPSLIGRTYVVTGGNAGIGYFSARQLLAAGARVVIAARNEARAMSAVERMRRETPGADATWLPLDLARYASVREAAAAIVEFPRLDGLLLNAGVTWPPARRETTDDGNELAFGTNHLGHFLLTALAWPALKRTAGSRVVTVSSMSTLFVRADLDDLQSERRYGRFRAYALSKHAQQAFAFELDRRARAAGVAVSALSAHPGWASGEAKRRGSQPLLRALVDPRAVGGAFYGPRWLIAGAPVAARPVGASVAPEFGGELWRLSEEWVAHRFML